MKRRAAAETALHVIRYIHITYAGQAALHIYIYIYIYVYVLYYIYIYVYVLYYHNG
jgi:hypothetical protein